MNNKVFFAAFLIMAFLVLAYFAMDRYAKYYNADIKSKPLRYAYQTYWGPPNPVLIIEDLKYKDSLLVYHDKISTEENVPFNIPLKTLPQFEPLYLVGYTEDSLLAEVVSYYDRGLKFGGSYLRGYVDVKTLHKYSPYSVLEVNWKAGKNTLQDTTTNLFIFNKAIKEGKSKEDAIKITYSGKWATEKKINNINIDKAKYDSSSGVYTELKFYISKTQNPDIINNGNNIKLNTQ